MTKPILIAILALAAAGCATDGATQLASAEPNCKASPITHAGSVGRSPSRIDPIEQRFAELQLANSSVRQAALQDRGMLNNNVEQILRDCATK